MKENAHLIGSTTVRTIDESGINEIILSRSTIIFIEEDTMTGVILKKVRMTNIDIMRLQYLQNEHFSKTTK